MVCEVCAKAKNRKNGRFCSWFCYLSYINKNGPINRSKGKRSGIYVNCLGCSKKIYRFPSQLERYNQYHKKCWYRIGLPEAWRINNKYEKARVLNSLKGIEARIGKPLSEEHKQKISNNTGRRFGDKNNLWKGGIASLQNTLRHRADYSKWRMGVYKRDNFKCQGCGTSKDLHAHHINSFSDYPDLRYKKDNGVALCWRCHSSTHEKFIPNKIAEMYKYA